jgi:hypothetical protein
MRTFQPKYRENMPIMSDTVPNYATWLIKDEILYTLFCLQDPLNSAHSVQLLYDQFSESVFYLRRDLWISNCPNDSVLLGHLIWDIQGNGHCTPNFLLFDVVRWNGKSMQGTHAKERYSLLRQITVHAESIVSIQYVGEEASVQRFVDEVRSGIKKLPHEIKKCITMSDDPFYPLYC